MTIADDLGLSLGFKESLALGIALSMAAALVATPRIIRKLRGARIVGRDRHKPGAPEIPEMGGLAVFLAFNVGAFAILALGDTAPLEQNLILASLVVIAGACITGVLDDLVTLRQRFKAFIPFAFAIPLSLYASDFTIVFPVVGSVDLGLLYPVLLVPLTIACASNVFNMLEGFNGLGAGLGIIMASALAFIALMNANFIGLALLFPLVGALGGFLVYNFYPAKVFPGDTMTLMTGAALGAAALLSKIEFWAGLMFVPHIIEFLLKLRARFKAQSFASRVEGGKLHHDGEIRSLTHVVMRFGSASEPQLVARMWLLQAVYAAAVVAAFAWWSGRLG